jgi:hypothetical protein
MDFSHLIARNKINEEHDDCNKELDVDPRDKLLDRICKDSVRDDLDLMGLVLKGKLVPEYELRKNHRTFRYYSDVKQNYKS